MSHIIIIVKLRERRGHCQDQLPCPDSVYSHWIFFFFSTAYCLMRYTILPFRYWDTGLSDTKKISSMSFSSIHSKTG